MPVTAAWDIPLPYDERRKKIKELEEVIKEHLADIPITEQKGAYRWARALGIL